MWACPKCAESLEDEFDICWQCGTDREGVEDEAFLAADDTEAILDPAEDQDIKPLPDLDDEFGERFPELVVCFEGANVMEARFVANQIRSIGIPAITDNSSQAIGTGVAGVGIWGDGPKVQVRQADLVRAMTWLEGYKLKCKERRQHPTSDEVDDD